MNPIARNILAVVVGLLVGCAANLGLVNTGPMVFPLPEGTDVTTLEGLRESMKLFKPVNFLFPFLGHAVGTLIGAWVVALLATPGNGIKFGLGIGVFFLLGGITMVATCGGPMWFIVLDLVVAYIPMGWLGGWLAGLQTDNGEQGVEETGGTEG